MSRRDANYESKKFCSMNKHHHRTVTEEENDVSLEIQWTWSGKTLYIVFVEIEHDSEILSDKN